MISLVPTTAITHVACIGAHPDDIEIGAAGLIRQVARANPSSTFSFLVLTGDAGREVEAKKSATALLGDQVRVRFGGFRDGFTPYDNPVAAKDFVKDEARDNASLVVAPYRADLHQDHSFAGSLAHQVFRDQLIIEYEIMKYDGDLGRPNLYIPLSLDEVDHKISHLLAHFESQRSNGWYTDDAFRGLMRLRGIEANSASGFAEAFHVSKMVLDLR